MPAFLKRLFPGRAKIRGYRIGSRWFFEMEGAGPDDLRACLDWLSDNTADGAEICVGFTKEGGNWIAKAVKAHHTDAEEGAAT